MQRKRLYYSSRYYCFCLQISKLSIHFNCPLHIHSRKSINGFLIVLRVHCISVPTQESQRAILRFIYPTSQNTTYILLLTHKRTNERPGEYNDLPRSVSNGETLFYRHQCMHRVADQLKRTRTGKVKLSHGSGCWCKKRKINCHFTFIWYILCPKNLTCA